MKRFVALLAVFCLLFAGCTAQQTEEGEYKLYYIAPEGNKLGYVAFEPESTDGSALCDALFNKIKTSDWIPEGGRPITSGGVRFGSLNVSRQIANIDLEGDYASMPATDKILLLSGIAYTFDQAADIDGINITINKEPLLDSNEQEVGIITKEDFVENDSRDINTYLNTELTLFFTDEIGKKLIPETRSVYYSSNELLQQVILDELIEGPLSQELKAILPSDLSYVSVTMQDKTCYVNFDDSFLSASFGADYEHVIYSIVNTLCFNGGVDNVHFSVNGMDDLTQYNLDLTQVFTPDWSMSI